MDGVREDLDRIDRLESEGDAIYRRALAQLFSGEFRALEVLKWKDIIEATANSISWNLTTFYFGADELLARTGRGSRRRGCGRRLPDGTCS